MKKYLLYSLLISGLGINAQTEIEPFAPTVPGTYIGGFDVAPLASIEGTTAWTSEGTATATYIFVGDNGLTLFNYTGSVGNYCAVGLNVAQAETLVSPPMDFGVYTDNPTLEFKWGQSQLHGILGATGYAQQSLEVLFREGATGSWTSLLTITTLDPAYTWHDETVDLSPVSDFSDLYIGFRVSSNVAGSFPGVVDYGQTVIDEIVVTGETACTPATSSFSETGCFSYTVPSGDETYTTSGIVMDTIPNSAATCDSIMTIDVTITTPDVGVTVAGSTLSASATGVTYQWIDCADSSLVAGATSADFMATQDGSYAVIINDGGCIDTSACSSIAGIGFDENQLLSFSMFPNPANELVTLIFEDANVISAIQVFSTDGKQVLYFDQVYSNNFQVDLSNLISGIYTVNVVGDNGTVNKILVKR